MFVVGGIKVQNRDRFCFNVSCVVIKQGPWGRRAYNIRLSLSRIKSIFFLFYYVTQFLWQFSQNLFYFLCRQEKPKYSVRTYFFDATFIIHKNCRLFTTASQFFKHRGCLTSYLGQANSFRLESNWLPFGSCFFLAGLGIRSFQKNVPIFAFFSILYKRTK